MAYDDQKEPALPVNGKSNRKSSDLLPRYFRTNANTKFLSATLDQVLKPGTAKKLNGYYGRKTATAYTPHNVASPPFLLSRDAPRFDLDLQ